MFVGLPSEDGYPHQGHLDFASISLTTTTGTLLMRGVFPNPDGKILPGLYARVRVPLEQRDARCWCPRSRSGTTSRARTCWWSTTRTWWNAANVKTGPAVESLRVIDDGLTGGEWVIVNGLLKAAPGRQVTPEREGGDTAAETLVRRFRRRRRAP